MMNNDSTKYAKKKALFKCNKSERTMPINFEDLTRTVASFSMKSGFNISVNA